MIKFIAGCVVGAAVMFYAHHRSPETEAKVKTEVSKRAAQVTQLTTKKD